MVSYDEVNLLAEIGGYIGLLLGFSLLDIAKLFRSLLEARFKTNQKFSSRIRNLQKYAKSVILTSCIFLLRNVF